MRQIRDNIWHVTYSDLGKPTDRGPAKVEGLGTVLIDLADVAYIKEYLQLGLEPSFFVSKSNALDGWMVVVSRQRNSQVPPYVNRK